MVSEDKLIQQGIRLTEAWFKKFKNQIVKDIGLCETYQEFLERTEQYTTSNILISSGYSAAMEAVILQILNDVRFERASQRRLIEETIRNNVGNLIRDVGEDIRETVRTTVSKGYDDGLHPYEIGRNISKELDVINHKRARTIARTEVKRTDTIANYVIAKEDGATSFTVTCRPDCCPYCAEAYDSKRTFDEQKEVLHKIDEMKRIGINDPLVKGKGEPVGGDVVFDIMETDKLPPLHPNCRCTVYYNY